MGDVSIPKPDPTGPQRVGARVQELIESGHGLYATTVTGSPSGRTRRPTLFLIAFAGLALGLIGIQLALVVAAIAMMALAYTDQVVEL